MGSKMLIDASHPEETRVVVLKGNRIEEFDFESAARRQLKGNIYLAKVTRVEPSLQAAFVEYGGNRHGFLAFAEIHPDYYQIPLADRMALLQAEEEEHARDGDGDDDDDDDNGHRQSSRSRGRRGGESSSGDDDGRGKSRSRTVRRGDGETETQAQSEGESEDTSQDNERHSDATSDADQTENDNDLSTGESPDGEDSGETEPSGADDSPRGQPLAATHDRESLSEPVESDVDAESSEDQPDATPTSDGEQPAEPELTAAAPGAGLGLPGDLGNGIEEVGEDPDTQKVESIGAEDAMEEVPQRRRKMQRRQYKIQEVIKRRQVILVQVVKEERGNKGAALTTYLSLAGRYCVLMPNTARGGGISRKITDSGDRRRLKEVAKEIEVPQGMGLIVRTAGAQRTKTEIKRDYDYLLRLWESVRDLTLKSQAPALVYEEGSLVKRAIRDLYTKDVDEVTVEGDDAYREAKDFMKMLMPSHAKNVKSYKDARPLFSRYQAESQLDGLYSPTVTLPSGGYMVINQTEALVSVDINSGKSTREHNIEDTALRTNLEASDEIARQLRLRDLAGLVVIDFIDMEEKRNNRNVERRLKDALKNDRARIQVGHISHFGLLEMSRQRLRPGLLEGSSRTCPHCEGRGIVRSISSCGLSVLRAVEEYLIARKPENLTVKCTREIAFYILNEKRDNLLSIETSYGISVFIVPSDDLKGSQAVIERAPERNIPPRKVMAAPVRMDTAFEEDDNEAAAEAEHRQGAQQAEDDVAEDDDAGGPDERPPQQNGDKPENGKKRRRRRGRRGGRDRDEQPGSGATTSIGDDVPGLGEQPGLDMVKPVEQQGDDAPTNADAGKTDPGIESSEQPETGVMEEGKRPPRARRDRWGRNRGDKRDKSEGADIEAMASTPAEPAAAAKSVAPAVVSMPVLEAPAEAPRKWQPPAATVAPAAAERKTGWWSKR
jgi:ribonuclease E